MFQSACDVGVSGFLRSLKKIRVAQLDRDVPTGEKGRNTEYERAELLQRRDMFLLGF